MGSPTMSARPLLLAIDQGTTSTRVLLFDQELTPRLMVQRELPQSFPRPGWVEHDPCRIAQDARELCAEAMARARAEDLGQVLGATITNQRETVVLWDRVSGEPLHPAIVWQDRRTAARCRELQAAGHEGMVRERTGLLLDPYFSATKIAWLLDHHPDTRARAARGELACGTIDCWLAWQLSGGRLHVTDATNASRTLLWNLRQGCWDPQLLALFDIPAELLPQVLPSSGPFGTLTLGEEAYELPLLGMVGDQQAAALSQGCFPAGAAKCTFGTGAFLVQSTGTSLPSASSGLLATTLYGDGTDTRFAVEGSIFSAGATVQWLRDGLGLFQHAKEIADLAAAADEQDRVYLVPAFTGLAAPYWQAEARAMLCGLSRGSERNAIARAALEASCYRTRDLLEAAHRADISLPRRLRIDGGMAGNDWFAQRLSDLLAMEVVRPDNPEATARGAAVVAGTAAAWWQTPEQAPQAPIAHTFRPSMPEAERNQRYHGWCAAVRACHQFAVDHSPTEDCPDSPSKP